jgi:hypothetical protein
MGQKVRIWPDVHAYLVRNYWRKEPHMKALVWSLLIVGMLIGLGLAVLVLSRVPVRHDIRTARITTADTFQGYLLERPSLKADPGAEQN